MQLLSFLRSRSFFTHLLLGLVTILLLLFGTYKWLNAYTNHGETISVPDIRGMKLKDIENFLSQKSLRFQIADSSAYFLDKPPGIVIEQDPAANNKVKEGRTIYVTITRTVPPGVKVPNLIDVSHRQAEAILGSFGLRIGEVIYKPDLARNAVLAMSYKGRELKPGEELAKGSAVDLVLGDGIGNTKVNVPELLGLTLEEAMFVLQASGINTGALIFDESVTDSTLAVVYKQVPPADNISFLKQGESIDLFLTQSESKIKSSNENP